MNKPGARHEAPNEPNATRRQEILDVAAQLLNEVGVSQTSLQDLGDRLGVTRNALYHYFADREQLLFEVYVRSCELYIARLRGAIAGGGAALGALQAFVRAMIETLEPEPASLNEHGLLGPARYKALIHRYDALVDELTSLLAQGVRTGELRACDHETVARSIISILQWIPLGGRWPSVGPLERRQMADLLCDLLARGWAMDRSALAAPPPIDLSPLLQPPSGAFDRRSLEDHKRETILSGASRMFNHSGVGATKLEDVAAAFGVSKQQLYRYVGNKQELVTACFERSRRIYGFIIAAARAGGGSACDQLLAIQRANALVQQHDDLQPLHFATSVGALGPADQEEANRRVRESRLQVMEIFQQGFREGSIRPFDLELQGRLTPGANTWLVKGLVERDEARKAEMSNTVADLLRIGLLAH